MTEAALDAESLRAKYRAERDKRLRADGNEQYLQPTGRFAHLLEDPYVQRKERAPRTDDVTVAVIGGGFAGLATGARLVAAGVTDLAIFEGGGDFGGAWYWNRYPGAMCDTAAMIYLPLLEETGHMPSHKYTMAAEIFGHAQRIGRHFGLYEKALFSTSVTGLRWDEAASRWIVTTDRGDRIRARFVTMGTGPLHRPKLPGIPGIEKFGGHAFHTSRWDYAYTGGSYEGAPMDKLGDKRVGVIGTGATAVQCIPPLARSAGQLFVFQRTPSSVDVRNNHAIDADWFGALEPGWQRKWLLNFATLQTGGFAPEDLVKDGWTDISQRIRDRVVQNMGKPGATFDAETMRQAYEDSDDDKMNEIRARVDDVVRDPAVAEALKPWYRQLCKRPCFHDEYLQAFNEPGVHLVDTDGKGVQRITADGVLAAGREHPVDLIIYASGFEVGTEFTRRAGYEITGRDGVRISEHWAQGMRTLHGVHVHGFPNMFIVQPTQGANLISNVPSNLTDAARTIAVTVEHAVENGHREVEVTAEAENAWVELLLTGPGRLLASPDCTPGYYNNEGQDPGPRARLNVGHPHGPAAFFAHIERWRSAGTFEGLAFR